MDLNNLLNIGESLTPSGVSGHLLGCVVRLKEIHYHTPNMDIHTQTDELIGDIREFEDAVSENIIGRTDTQKYDTAIHIDYVYGSACQIVNGLIEYCDVIKSNYPTTENLCKVFVDKLSSYKFKLEDIIVEC